MAKTRVASTKQKVLKLTKWLSDEQTWSWTTMHSDRDASDMVLEKMAELGLVQHKEHPLGGNIWTVGRRKFGRVDQ